MNFEILKRHFDNMGARLTVGPLVAQRFGVRPRLNGLVVDVKQDRRGEFFDIQVDSVLVDLEVVDVRPQDRHLLMLARHMSGERKDKFICGHDERSWFVAAVPEQRGVSSVRTALEALKPPAVRDEQDRRRVKTRHRQRRRTSAFVRQGEWFFVPREDFEPPAQLVLYREPLQRGGGKPHMCELLVRTGGQTVYVCGQRPRGLSPRSYRNLLDRDPQARSWNWMAMRRNPDVHARGAVRHPDHKTIHLPSWHLVQMNTESAAPAMRHVVFLD